MKSATKHAIKVAPLMTKEILRIETLFFSSHKMLYVTQIPSDKLKNPKNKNIKANDRLVSKFSLVSVILYDTIFP